MLQRNHTPLERLILGTRVAAQHVNAPPEMPTAQSKVQVQVSAALLPAPAPANPFGKSVQTQVIESFLPIWETQIMLCIHYRNILQSIFALQLHGAPLTHLFLLPGNQPSDSCSCSSVFLKMPHG